METKTTQDTNQLPVLTVGQIIDIPIIKNCIGLGYQPFWSRPLRRGVDSPIYSLSDECACFGLQTNSLYAFQVFMLVSEMEKYGYRFRKISAIADSCDLVIVFVHPSSTCEDRAYHPWADPFYSVDWGQVGPYCQSANQSPLKVESDC